MTFDRRLFETRGEPVNKTNVPPDPAYRVGRHNPRNIYRNNYTGNPDDDTHVAVVLDEDDADLFATALSAFTAALGEAEKRAANTQAARDLHQAMTTATGGGLGFTKGKVSDNAKLALRVADQVVQRSVSDVQSTTDTPIPAHDSAPDPVTDHPHEGETQ